MLQMLLDSAKANAEKKPGGRRYTSTMKELGTLIFTLGGPLLYSILSPNLGFPSVSEAGRTLMRYSCIQEGVFRFKELKKLLVEKGYPMKIHVSEDATAVEGRVQYDLKTNQIIGFVLPYDSHGLPVINSFPATSATVIQEHYKRGVVSNNGYVLMAQPLADDAPAFCLGLYGTDGRFDSVQVQERWKSMMSMAKEEGIEIVSIASDGDAKLLNAMCCQTFVTGPSVVWPWYSASLNKRLAIFIQDSIHYLVKLKSKLMKASEIIPMGKDFFASRGHLVELINTVSKDQHNITISLIDPKDKMNFRGAQKICDEKVTSLLRQKVYGSEATATYLDMMRETSSAFLDPLLSPLERVHLLWKWLFFQRLWRKWIVQSDNYTLSHNFVSSNSFTCLEVNAHGVIDLIRKFRDAENPELFQMIIKISSQQCEEFFRKARSLTTMTSTKTNFSVLEFIHKVRRIDFLASSFNSLKDKFVFPLKHRKHLKLSENKAAPFPLPEDYEIQQCVENSFKIALKKCVDMGIVRKNAKCPSSPLPVFQCDTVTDVTSDEEDNLEVNMEEQGLEEPCDNDCENDIAADGVLNDELNDVLEDLLIISTGALGLRTFKDVNATPTSPFVEVLDGNGDLCIIKKTSLCWLLNSGDVKLSSDRLLRVQAAPVQHSKRPLPSTALNSHSKPHVEECISIGDWCAFDENGGVYVGRVSAFSYMSGPTWRKQEYSLLSAPVKAPNSATARGLGCLCSWFKICSNRKLTPIKMDTHGYFPIETYICSLPRPIVERNYLILSCSLQEILQLQAH